MTSNWIHTLFFSQDDHKTKPIDTIMRPSTFYTPGDIISSDSSSFICGHGTYPDSSTSCIISSVAGNVEYINKLVRVIPPKTRYLGEVGDVVIGRVLRVCQKKWVIDLNAQQPATLQLAAIYLPGNVQRRKLEEDELQIRQFFIEGDLVSAEVQSVHADGSVAIHTRSIKYGKVWHFYNFKLFNGMFLALGSRNIKRSSSHFISLSCGVDLILGINGYVWIGLPIDTQARLNTANIIDGNPYALSNRTLSDDERASLSRIRNCLIILDNYSIPISEASIMKCYEIGFNSDIPSILKRNISLTIATQIEKDDS